MIGPSQRIAARTGVLVLFAFGAASIDALAHAGASGDRRPNVLLIVAHGQGLEAMSIPADESGVLDARTPTLYALSASGILFPLLTLHPTVSPSPHSPPTPASSTPSLSSSPDAAPGAQEDLTSIPIAPVRPAGFDWIDPTLAHLRQAGYATYHVTTSDFADSPSAVVTGDYWKRFFEGTLLESEMETQSRCGSVVSAAVDHVHGLSGDALVDAEGKPVMGPVAVVVEFDTLRPGPPDDQGYRWGWPIPCCARESVRGFGGAEPRRRNWIAT